MRHWKPPVFLPTWSTPRHVKNVPGRKTDMADSEWLAQLGHFGLVRPSFSPPKDLRELRLVSQYRQKLSQKQVSEKNRLHKILDDAGIKLGAVVADIDRVSARAMIEGLIAGKPIDQLADLAKGMMRHKREALELSLEGELTARHHLVLKQIQAQNRYFGNRTRPIRSLSDRGDGAVSAFRVRLPGRLG